jgi:acyl-CoA reductase-like NAD-dependent aldehyde dehydrogenase
MFVGGAWTGAASGATFTAESPATGEAIGEVPQGGREDAQRAIEAAGRAAGGWAHATAFERAAAMHRVADVVESRRDALARTLTLDQGKPLRAEAYDEPTILDGVPADAHVPLKETFGPVAPVVAIDSLGQAIEPTNASPGLLASIFTADLRRGLEFADRVVLS